MQQTITDKILDQKFLPLAGAFILLLIIFFNFPKSNSITGNRTSDNELHCEWPGETAVSLIFMEDLNEDDPDKIFLYNPFKTFYSEFSGIPIQNYIENSTTRISTIKNHFQSDLSPPHLM